MCDPILVTLLKMRPHYSQSSRENETPSSGTSPLAFYKEVPLPPGVPSVCTFSENNGIYRVFQKFVPIFYSLKFH